VYIDQKYGNRGCLIDFHNDREILAALRLAYDADQGEDPASLAFLDSLTDSTEYCKRCEHVIVVISRWARCAAYTSTWIIDNVDEADRRHTFATKLYFPDFRAHNPTAYPPHLFDPGPLITVTPKRGRVSDILREVGKQTTDAAESGYPANTEAIKQIVIQCLPLIHASVQQLQKQSGDAAGTDPQEQHDPYFAYDGTFDYSGSSYTGPYRGINPPLKRHRPDDDAPAGGGSGAPPTGRGGGPGGGHGAGRGGAPARRLNFADPAPGTPAGTANPGVLFRKPSELYHENAHPAVVASIRAVVNQTAHQIMDPDKVFRLTQASGDYDSTQVLGLETIGGKSQIRAMAPKRSIRFERDLMATLFIYQNSFIMALQPDVTRIGERWSSTLINDINNQLQSHGLPTAVEYLRHIVMQIGINLRSPTYEGGRLVAIDFHRDESALLAAANRCLTQDRSDRSGPDEFSSGRKKPNRERQASSGSTRAKPTAGPTPVLPLADRPPPSSKAGAGPPSFAVTQAIRTSLCTNNSKGFPCAFEPCPYDHSK
jgi:hypothetical protein